MTLDRRVRVLALTLLLAAAATALSSLVPGTHALNCTGIDDPGPCVQAAAGFPFPFIVDHWLYSPGGRADLAGALFGLDLFLGRQALATLLFWWIALLALRAATGRP